MEQYLTVNDLWDIVSGHETEPSSDTEKAAFLRKQRSACACIALHISPAQLTAIHLKSDPMKIWEELQCLNRPHGFGTHMVLHCKLANMKWGPHLSMSTWITSVRDIALQIQDLKGNVAEEDIIVILTNSLLETYTPLVVQLDVMEEKECTLSHVITHLVGEECCQNGDKNWGEDTIALAATQKLCWDCANITCFRCGEKGHYHNECPKVKEVLNPVSLSVLY